ncbi:MAG TPA: [protein-PII] uridylyltransferase [Pelagibacterium sp.]|uniref:[protein-PII] uridylyltransferase n=1 Tax=Pelagibacterium sp. TaxID=1967288 RepID=UPI002C3BE7E7|nr:[protein-PII] uridylyltransferase [Pelagibacterium sp.]HWJ88231.1 [protein-PII] uridylyltransferase [Pelagibacterium sp.]
MPTATSDPTARKRAGLIDALALLARVREAIGENAPDSPAARAILLAALRTALREARTAAEADLIATRKGTRCAKTLSNAQDELIRAIHLWATQYVFVRPTAGEAESFALAAVGGYGRGTLAPGSDIDLLFILPSGQTPWSESVTEYILYMLWDLGQKVGHAVRSVEDSIRMARSDMTVRTATLESRFLAGDQSLFSLMRDRFETEIVADTGPEFIAAKMAERDARHDAQGNTRYVVEPNVKDGKGGLRDLNTLYWIGKYFYRVRTPAELIAKGVFSSSEYRTFQRSEDFLWAVRCNLHFLLGRSDDRLAFDSQQEMARRMGYDDRAGLLGVERFMKRYFLVAKDVGDLTRIFCTSLEFAHAKTVSAFGRVLPAFRKARRPIRGEPDFVLEHGRLTVASEDVFAADPVNIIKIFWVAGREGVMFHPEALKLLTRSMRLIDARLRADPRANTYFLEILTNAPSVERVLRRMNESGVLGRFVPEFGKIVALMQFNMYHHYTVDEHLIRAVGVMAEIASGGLVEELPLTHELLPHLSDVRLLYVALFLHDIAKGRPEDHSKAAETIARKFCARLGLSAAETDTVAWLVRHHLLMSEIAQSRDIQDPETARSFAQIVQSPQRLALLMILTACDIRAVGPGVWTGWKGSLLRALYYATEPLLSGGHSQVSQHDRVIAAQNALRAGLSDWPPARIDTYIERHFTNYWLRAEPELQLAHAHMIEAAQTRDSAFARSIAIRAFEGITEITFYTPDHPRLLSLIAGACTMADASIIGAQIFNTRDGHALDTFRLRRAFTADEDERIRASRITDTVRGLLEGTIVLPADLGAESRHNRRIKPFSVPTEIIISNALSTKFTVIEISGLDRTGLLYHLTRALSDLNLTIGSAHIGTYGEKAVDVFYVTDLMGGKITSKARQTRIREALEAVFAPARREKVSA